METELNDFEKSIQREINAFLNPEKRSGGRASTPSPQQTGKPHRTREQATPYKTGHLVKLAVRTRKLERDTVFEYQSASISKLEAQLEAEKAARQAGYPIIGYVVDIQRL
jgi:hypothetical protein